MVRLQQWELLIGLNSRARHSIDFDLFREPCSDFGTIDWRSSTWHDRSQCYVMLGRQASITWSPGFCDVAVVNSIARRFTEKSDKP